MAPLPISGLVERTVTTSSGPIASHAIYSDAAGGVSHGLLSVLVAFAERETAIAMPPAKLEIEQFNPGITNNQDLVQLRAVTGGSVLGFTLEQGLASPAPERASVEGCTPKSWRR